MEHMFKTVWKRRKQLRLFLLLPPHSFTLSRHADQFPSLPGFGNFQYISKQHVHQGEELALWPVNSSISALYIWRRTIKGCFWALLSLEKIAGSCLVLSWAPRKAPCFSAHQRVPPWRSTWMLGCADNSLLKQLLCPSCCITAVMSRHEIQLRCSTSCLVASVDQLVFRNKQSLISNQIARNIYRLCLSPSPCYFQALQTWAYIFTADHSHCIGH